jgi:hypothetical protein
MRAVMSNLNRFYTYAYLRKNRTPYYIGKGNGDRIYKRKKNDVKPPKDKSRIIFLKQNLTEEEAFKHEKYMIVVFGRKDLGTGILHNRTDGGQGFTLSKETRKKISNSKKGKYIGKDNPFYGKTHSEKTRKKLSKALSRENNPNFGKSRPEEVKIKIREKNIGKFVSPESKNKMSLAHKGKTLSEEHKKKIKKSCVFNMEKNKKLYCPYIYTFTSPTGQITETYDIVKFSKENELTISKVNATSRGLQSHHKGWKISRVPNIDYLAKTNEK